jgi:hypothetical protein
MRGIFENCESSVMKLTASMFKSLYVWMAAHNGCFSNFLEFLDLCSP